MASTGECRENAAAPAMARALKSGVGCIWGRPRRLSGVSENSVIYPTLLDELEDSHFSPLPHLAGGFWNLPAPLPRGGKRWRGRAGPPVASIVWRPSGPALRAARHVGGAWCLGPRVGGGGGVLARPRARHPETGGAGCQTARIARSML